MYSANIFIGGAQIERTSSARFEILNPATEEILGTAPGAGPAEVEAAIAAAAKGLAAWRAVSAFERSNRLRRIGALIRERLESLATLVTQEVGKPLAEARMEVTAAAEYFEWAAEEARRILGYARGGRLPESRYDGDA